MLWAERIFVLHCLDIALYYSKTIQSLTWAVMKLTLNIVQLSQMCHSYVSSDKNLVAFHCNFYEGGLKWWCNTAVGTGTLNALNFIVCNKMQSSKIQMKPNDTTATKMLGRLNQFLLKCLQPSVSRNSLILTGINMLRLKEDECKIAAPTYHLFTSSEFSSES